MIQAVQKGLESVKDSQSIAVAALRESSSRTMLGVILAIITVLGTFILGHFGPGK